MANKYPAKRLYSMGNQYYSESVYEYRDHEYTVTFSSGYSCFEQKPAYIQHRENQARIDELIAHPVVEEKKEFRYEDSADYAVDMFLKYCEEG